MRDVRAWMKDRRAPQVFRLFGYAGTGKSTLARELANGVKGHVCFAAFTGKAALVMKRKGCADASTIHSLIYRLDEDAEGWEPKFNLNKGSAVRDAALVVIDECSMVDKDLGQDLLSFGTRVLVLGDPAQLPPVKGSGYFTEGVEPDVRLTEVHRQARDNPIIAMSMRIREGEPLDVGSYGTSRVIEREQIDAEQILEADQVIVGMNRTRENYNRRIRTLLDRTDPLPVVDDKLVCLRNDKEKKLLNGSLWRVHKPCRNAVTRDNAIDFSIVPEDEADEPKPTNVQVRKEFFLGGADELHWKTLLGSQQFAYGYALTCHKSQGSQWNSVVVFDEAAAFREDARRWRYTAVTRAAERVTIVR